MSTKNLYSSFGRKEIKLASSHKILPANKVEKNLLLIHQATSNNKKFIKDPSDALKQLRANNQNISSKKTNLQTLKDKIFSPGDFLSTKAESKHQKLINEISKKLLQQTSLVSKSNEQRKSLNTYKHVSNLRYLPEKYCPGKKTLILDLDETLVHSVFQPFFIKPDITLKINFEDKPQTIYVYKRPFVDEFLDKMSKIYEIVIFTASIPEYANPLLNKLDTKRRISHRLFRQHCTQTNCLFMKDLKKIGRDLKDTIIIDNNPVSYVLNKDNGIPIITWHNNQSDTELNRLIPLLDYLAKADDVREVLKKVINGNYVNYHEVNKLIKKSNDKNDKNSHSFFNFDSPLLSKKTNEKIKGKEDILNKTINSSRTRGLLDNTFGTTFFLKDKKPGDIVRESLNNFDSNKTNNLFDDKVFQEKYEHFYDQNQNLNSSKNFVDSDMDIILPSNNYRSSSLGLTMRRLGSGKDLFSSSKFLLKQNDSYTDIHGDNQMTYTLRQRDPLDMTRYNSPLRGEKSSLSRSLERGNLDFQFKSILDKKPAPKISKYTAKRATISLNEKAAHGSLDEYKYKTNVKFNSTIRNTKRNISSPLKERLNFYYSQNALVKGKNF